jgi:hypothetical protein
MLAKLGLTFTVGIYTPKDPARRIENYINAAPFMNSGI